MTFPGLLSSVLGESVQEEAIVSESPPLLHSLMNLTKVDIFLAADWLRKALTLRDCFHG